jgi:hypothetical protein
MNTDRKCPSSTHCIFSFSFFSHNSTKISYPHTERERERDAFGVFLLSGKAEAKQNEMEKKQSTFTTFIAVNPSTTSLLVSS